MTNPARPRGGPGNAPSQQQQDGQGKGSAAERGTPPGGDVSMCLCSCCPKPCTLTLAGHSLALLGTDLSN